MEIWKFAFENGIEIDDRVDEGTRLRENDSMIINKFVITSKTGIITKCKWGIAKRCSVYLKPLSVADISTENEHEINTYVRKGMSQYQRIYNIE